MEDIAPWSRKMIFIWRKCGYSKEEHRNPVREADSGSDGQGFSRLYGTQIFITVSTKVRHWTLSRDSL